MRSLRNGERRSSRAGAEEFLLVMVLCMLGLAANVRADAEERPTECTTLPDNLPMVSERLPEPPVDGHLHRVLELTLSPEEISAAIVLPDTPQPAGGPERRPLYTLPLEHAAGCEADLHFTLADTLRTLLEAHGGEHSPADVRLNGHPESPFCRYVQVRVALEQLAREELVSPAILINLNLE